MMKALSIRQPWAWAITMGWKPVENRTWPTSYRGPVAIHAGQREERDDLPFVLSTVARQTGLPVDGLEHMYAERRWLGRYVGHAVITDCVTTMESPWFFGPFGFRLEGAVSFRTASYPGRLGVYTVPEPAAADIQALVDAYRGGTGQRGG